MANIPDEGVVSHIRKLREITKQFGEELDALKRLEEALRTATDRLERGASLVGIEARLVGALINRETANKDDRSMLQVVKRVEDDLAALIQTQAVPEKVPAE